MKAKMPRCFAEDEEIFGNDPGQHPYGTKLVNHLPCTVVGSRWKTENYGGFPGMPSTFADNREPMYVVYMHGELSQIGIMDAHMDGEVGWKAVGWDAAVNPRLDALARAHQSVQGGDEESLDGHSAEVSIDGAGEISVQTINRQVRQTLKRLHSRGAKELSMEPWNKSKYGNLLERFFTFSFDSSERNNIMNFGGQKSSEINANTIAERIKAFPMGQARQHDDKNFLARLVMSRMVAYHTHDGFGAVIISNERKTKFQAIEINNWHSVVLSHGAGTATMPVISITYATDPEGVDNPKEYLRGEKFKIMEVPNDIAIELENHLLNSVSNEGFNDIASGLLYHEGYLVPMEIVPVKEGRAVSVKQCIPDVNFGVELELSCASGNYQRRIASSIAKHTQLDVKVAGPIGKGRKGGEFNPQKGPRKDSESKSKHDKWRLVYDKSIEPNARNPQSLTFEIISPILSGSSGLEELSNTIAVAADVACIRVNETMGLHVHIEAKEDDYSLMNMKSVCQRFLIYEDAIDSMLSRHRQSLSDDGVATLTLKAISFR
ncbi:hypothetical protein ACHAWF_004729 [Thalassiosira exigua]